ncbi:hypothetical protein BFJ69_g17245 [Fusarium oxysporum]|uniref:GATA-type domain-containing protein n=1 Tax=Fusarium oxysporum TaxID=5507 RepID=A0A420M8V7_FUSOX|nr:hypothetical protein BFJ69_g17245 [Fusarium oxysporum]
MVFSIEPRKQDDSHESPNRQSPPSISEVIQGTEPGPYTFRPPSSIQAGFSLSPPFTLVRQPLHKTEKHPFLQQLLPASSFPLRQYALPVFSDHPRPPFANLPSFLPTSDCSRSPSSKAEIPFQHRHSEQQKAPEPHPPLSGVSSSRTILHCAEAYNRIAREQHGTHLIPERLPTEWELSDMFNNMELIKRSLEHMKDLVQTSIQNQRTHEGVKMKCLPRVENHAPISAHAMQPSFSMTEIKKQRARTTRPRRCHRCSRIDTPEWRRGPDGARTLCNACGLHYAKLKRKRQLKASSIGPKPGEAHRP